MTELAEYLAEYLDERARRYELDASVARDRGDRVYAETLERLAEIYRQPPSDL